ncbi:MAG: cation:proton antiporter [Rickettsiaceae bacterium]|nr:MAG: cation:proton antiporter [Rickettsiaceae bacterium]
MIDFVNQHLPALQVLLPLLGALVTVISFNKRLAQIITIIVSITIFLVSFYSFLNIELNIYNFGNWHSSIGIEYKLVFFNKLLILFSNTSLLLLIFSQKLIHETVIVYIDNKRQNLFYSILLFAHTGYIGILSTNDIFNLYVFIEISSLSAYVLVAQGGNNRVVQGAFDYLIIGSIGATLILIGIGFLLSCMGTLNITQLKLGAIDSNAKIIFTAGCFIVIGTMLKMALFPMHFWLRRVYATAPPVILMYTSSISSVVGCCILLKFFYICIDHPYLIAQISSLVIPVTLVTICLCSFLALNQSNLRHIAIYSSAISVGYIILLIFTLNDQEIILKFLCIDGINKISLFLIISQTESRNFSSNRFWLIFVVLTIICSAGLPLSAMFVLKLSIFEFFIIHDMYVALLIVTISSAISILYHYKIAQNLLMNNLSANKQVHYHSSENLVMILLISLQVIAVIFCNSKLNWPIA